MLDIQKYLNSHDFKTDELGRLIIDDLTVLEKINGAMFAGPEFMVPDTACGNANCVC